MGGDDAPQEKLWVVPAGSRLEFALGDLSAAEYDGRPWIEHLVDGLPDVEQEVIKRRFGLGGFEPSTFEEAGHAMDYSREWIRQLQNRALGRISVLAQEIRERDPK